MTEKPTLSNFLRKIADDMEQSDKTSTESKNTGRELLEAAKKEGKN